eukprot:1186355-Amphidinium_carterae.1
MVQRQFSWHPQTETWTREDHEEDQANSVSNLNRQGSQGVSENLEAHLTFWHVPQREHGSSFHPPANQSIPPTIPLHDWPESKTQRLSETIEAGERDAPDARNYKQYASQMESRSTFSDVAQWPTQRNDQSHVPTIAPCQSLCQQRCLFFGE